MESNNKSFKLTPSHIKFIEKYAETGNGTQSYRYAFPKATYATARSEAADLLKVPEIATELAAKKEELAQKFDANKEKIVNDLIIKKDQMLEAGDHNGYLKCVDMLIKLFGFYAPVNQNLDVTSGGEPITTIRLIEVKKSDEE
jgi:hypothetical protein